MESYYNRFSYHTNDKVKIHLKPKGTGELKNSKISKFIAFKTSVIEYP